MSKGEDGGRKTTTLVVRYYKSSAQYNSATQRQKRAWLGRGENLNWRHHDALALHVKRMALVHCGVVSTFQNGARFFSIREASVPFMVGVPVG